MKKNILFIEEGLGVGGAEKSLLTILENIDYKKYNVDLFLFRHSGTFMNLIPKEVNLLNEDMDFKIFNSNRKIAPIRFLLKGRFKKSFNALIYLIKAAYSNIILKKQYIGWDNISPIFSKINKEYDVSISFLERKTFYFNVDKVNSLKKIGFIHIDYNKIQYDYNLDNKYFKYFNNIATVSNHCKEVLINLFPQYKEKFIVIKNMISVNIIKEMSKEKVDFKKSNNETIIVTVGRLTYQKGIDNAIIICKDLISKGYKIKWLVIGKGEDKEKLEELIKKYNLENKFILKGVKTNPYKYIKNCDIYVQPSRFEGYGITIAEAKALNKPIVASNIPEFKEQLINNKTGLIASSNDEFVKNIIKLIENKEIKYTLKRNLIKEDSKENGKELEKLCRLF